MESRRRRWSSNEADLSGLLAASREADADRESRCKPWTRVIDADIRRGEPLHDESLRNQDRALSVEMSRVRKPAVVARRALTLELRPCLQVLPRRMVRAMLVVNRTASFGLA